MTAKSPKPKTRKTVRRSWAIKPERLSSINVNKDVWLYAEPRFLCVVQQVFNSVGSYVGTGTAEIPWRYVRKAMKHAPPARKRK